MKTLILSFLSIVVLMGAPSVAADEAPPATTRLYSPAADFVPVVEFNALTTCHVDAECAPFEDIWCEDSGSESSCEGADRDCSNGERGYVTCDEQTTYCGGVCCGADGVCEEGYGCASDPDCPDCEDDGFCNYSECWCSDPDCEGTKFCPSCAQCQSITDCVSNFECSLDCPGSICTPSGTCLCAG